MADSHEVVFSGYYLLRCLNSDGEEKWREEFPNVVFDEAREAYLKTRLKGNTAEQASTWFVGLVAGKSSNLTFNSSDTADSTSLGYSESTAYTEAARPKWASGTVGSTAIGTVSNSTSVATFTLDGGSTLGGAFLGSSSIKGTLGSSGNTWHLHSAGTLSQTRNPSSGDSLEVTIIQKATT